LDKATNTRRLDVEGKAGKEEWSGETTCAELVGDNVDEAVDLIEAEHDVMLVREVAVVLVRLAGPCDDDDD